MFRTVSLSIISSFSLYTHQWYMSYRFADSLRAGSGRFLKFIFGIKLYMFRTVPLSIIRSFFTAHTAMVYVIQVCWQLASRIRTISQIYFWNKILNVSDSSSVYHQDFFHCTHSNGVCHTGLLTACEQDQDDFSNFIPKIILRN
jgi:hypothetical protein